jgi:hypothetical protein
MKGKFLKLISGIILVILLFNLQITEAAHNEILGEADDTDGVALYTAGLSNGTQADPTGEPGGEPTDDVVEEAVLAGLLEMIGDQSEEVLDFDPGPPETYESERDDTMAEVTEGLMAIDDFGLIEEGADPESNYDAGIGGWVLLGNFGQIKADGIENNNTLGHDPGLTPEQQLRGNEIFLYEDAELSGIIVSLRTLNGDTINFTIEDRQIDPNTTAGADDTLITIDLDTLPGFDEVNDAVIEILIVDDAISMEGTFYQEDSPELPIWGDSTLELDAVATLVAALEGEISGYKWNDTDGDGVKDVGEPGLADWTIVLSGDESDSTTTDLNGFYRFEGLVTGNYVVSEVLKSGWEQTHPGGDGTHSISLDPGENSTNNNFGNIRPVGSISGIKWNDTDGDGVKDAGEHPLEGWTIRLSGDESASTTTAADGSYIFEDLLEGSYTVSEVQKFNWIQTAPGGSGVYNINLPAGGISENNNFGNQYSPPPPSVGGEGELLETTQNKNNNIIEAVALLSVAAILIYASRK